MNEWINELMNEFNKYQYQKYIIMTDDSDVKIQ